MDTEKDNGLLERIEEGSISGTEDNVENKDSSFRRDVSEIFLKYVDRCTMTGISFIKNSEHKSVKAAWSLLLFVAFFVMVGHLVMLFASYYEFKSHSKIIYTFSPLPFPAVTFCNVNPVRISMKSEPELDWFIKTIDDIEVNATDELPLIDVPVAKNGDPGEGDSSTILDDFLKKADEEMEHRENETDLIEDLPEDASLWYTVLSVFQHIYSHYAPETRIRIGHQLHDMMVECYYNGHKCNMSFFQLRSSMKYGNCYTLECPGFLSSESGPDKGLTMIFRLELDEYMPILSESKGAVLVVHERETLAFPDEDSIALAAGSENMIGIQQIVVNRLNKPYGECTPDQKFKEEYGISPTRNTCLKICRQKQFKRECGCYNSQYSEINRIMRLDEQDNFCNQTNELKCIRRIEQSFHKYSVKKCHCNDPCKETKFRNTISTRRWPTTNLTTILASSICVDSPKFCDGLDKKPREELQDEFLKVNIYYEDLNHEVYTETPDYELTQFLSDIGGTIGLWIGLSILGVCEVLHLIIELSIYLARSLCSVTRRGDKNGHSHLPTV